MIYHLFWSASPSCQSLANQEVAGLNSTAVSVGRYKRAKKGKEASKPRLFILGVETEFERFLTLVLRQLTQQIVNCVVTQSGHVS